MLLFFNVLGCEILDVNRNEKTAGKWRTSWINQKKSQQIEEHVDGGANIAFDYRRRNKTTST